MGLPTLTKTWQFAVNQNVSGTADADQRHKALALALKNILIGFASNPWDVRGSSDGNGSAGMDQVDRWSGYSDINYLGQAQPSQFSWIVLRQSAINGANFELCIAFSNALGTRIAEIVISPSAGFTGGSTTARPTATDERTEISGAWGGNFTGAEPSYPHIVHAMQSSDGELTRIVIYYNTTPFVFWLFDKPGNQESGWTEAALWIVHGGPSVVSEMYFADFYNSSSNSRLWDGVLGSDFATYFSCESRDGNALGEMMTAPSPISGEWPIVPIGLMSEDASRRCRPGEVVDLWWGSTAADASEYPNDTSKQFAQFGHLIFPWNGTTVVRG